MKTWWKYSNTNKLHTTPGAIIICLLLLAVLGTPARASDIDLEFSEVVLVSRACWAPPGQEVRKVQGDYAIIVKGVGTKKELHITFSASDPDYAAMIKNIEIQYKVSTADFETEWSYWQWLGPLSLVVDLRDRGEHWGGDLNDLTPSQVMVQFRFRFPESVYVRAGVYIGQICLEVDKE